MTSAAQAGHGPVALPEQSAVRGLSEARGAGALHRRPDRRRRTIERTLAALVLLAAFAATVVLLGLQWLDSPSNGSIAPPASHIILTSEVQPS
ncbi:MAG TPA: hypothetical protein VFN61_13855 [Acidimicrobiales bacterium]|nr:hypothetical protein [Acidimicrobiales bacterium]